MKLHCLKPVEVFLKKNDEKTISYNPCQVVSSQLVPCGICYPCKKEKRRQWALRLQCESLMHENQCFITLTYENAPESVSKRDCQLFLKRLRKSLKKKISYYLTAEYGSNTNRAHYHAIIFGHNFRDHLTYKVTSDLYSHPTLESAWGLGHCSIGQVTPASINYVASYSQKKLDRKQSEKFYNNLGEIRTPEFSLMSKRPAIGLSFYQKYQSTLEKHGTIIINGTPVAVPNYFNRISDKFFTDQIIFDPTIDTEPLEVLISKSQKISLAELRAIKQKELL